MSDVNDITEVIVDACVCVHKKFGPGLLESVYEKILMVELQKRGLVVECQKPLPVVYEEDFDFWKSSSSLRPCRFTSLEG